MKLDGINWVFVIVILTLLSYAYRGKREGFIRTVFGMFSFILALLAASVLGPGVSTVIKSNEKIIPYLSQKVEGDSLTLPDIIKASLDKNQTSESFTKLAVEKSEDYIKAQLANWMVNAVAYIVVFVLVLILLWYLSHTLNIISKLPVINGLNKTAGFFVGILRGFVTIWMWCIVLMIFGTSHWGQIIFTNINDNAFLSLLYNNNLLLEFGKIML
ncbi:MAG: hypothetical protein PWP24_1789 [Clostridiales bacterium]|nr:hypothetical protein [Clostridiales bacterium]